MDVAIELTGIHLLGVRVPQIISNCTTSLQVGTLYRPKVNVFLDITRSEFQKETKIAFYTRFMQLIRYTTRKKRTQWQISTD